MRAGLCPTGKPVVDATGGGESLPETRKRKTPGKSTWIREWPICRRTEVNRRSPDYHRNLMSLRRSSVQSILRLHVNAKLLLSLDRYAFSDLHFDSVVFCRFGLEKRLQGSGVRAASFRYAL